MAVRVLEYKENGSDWTEQHYVLHTHDKKGWQDVQKIIIADTIAEAVDAAEKEVKELEESGKRFGLVALTDSQHRWVVQFYYPTK